MKIYYHILILVTALFACSQPAEAQFLEKLQKRAEKRAQQRVENKIEKQVDQAVDKTVDAPENAVKENKKNKKSAKKDSAKDTSSEANLNISSLMNASKNVALPETYEFGHKVTYVMATSTSKQSNEMTYWFGADEAVFAIAPGHDTNTLIVYDMEQDAMVMFSQKERNVQVMPFSMFGAIYDNSSDDEIEVTFKKTGETKKISGYNCQKYVMISENLEGEFWFTKEVKLPMPDFSKAFLSVSKSSNQNIPNIDPNEHGFMLEMKATDTSTNAVTQMTVKEITSTSYSIKTSDYKKAGM